MKFNEICQMARDNGMLDDPRVTYDSPGNELCGFRSKFPKDSLETTLFPKVCGNCSWYSVQEQEENTNPEVLLKEAISIK